MNERKPAFTLVRVSDGYELEKTHAECRPPWQARIAELEAERDVLREALRRMVLLVDIRLDAGDVTSGEYDDFAGASKLVGAVAPHRVHYAERGLASIRAAVEVLKLHRRITEQEAQKGTP